MMIFSKKWLREIWDGVCGCNPYCQYWIQTGWIKEQCRFLMNKGILVHEKDGKISGETTTKVINELKRIGGVDGKNI